MPCQPCTARSAIMAMAARMPLATLLVLGGGGNV
jgi:hypothetical protein